jgi:hypothetical protein
MKECDWKLLSSKKEELLNKLCENIIKEIEMGSKDTTKTFHQRYWYIYSLIRDRDRTIADIFNRWSRSQFDNIVIQMIREGLLDKTMNGFSEETKVRIQSFL